MRYLLYMFCAILTAIVGYNLHHSIVFAIMDYIFWPFVWLKWIVLHEVNLTFVKQCFSYFLT